MKKNLIIAIAMCLLSTFAKASDVIYRNLRPAERLIVNDILMADINPSCIRNAATGQCDLLLQNWSNAQSYDPEGKKYLDSLSSKPPHIKGQIMKADFGKSYKQMLEARDQNFCFDYDQWKFINSNTGYFLASEVSMVNERPTANNYKIVYVPSNDMSFQNLILQSSPNTYIQEIPNKYITEEIYGKIKSLLGDSFIRVCGKITTKYSIDQLVGRKLTNLEMQAYTVEPFVMNFVLSKPIEIYKNGAKVPAMKIPFEWYK